MSAARAVAFGLLAALCVATAGESRAETSADPGWFEAGDIVLRNDLLLLNDAGVIRLPVSQWPLPRAAVSYALRTAKEHLATNRAVLLALARVRSRIEAARPFSIDASATGGEAALLRQFGTLGREPGEISVRAASPDGKFAQVALRVTGVADPADERSIRLDGSHATVHLGNWLLSAQALDRWWGPGHEGSLILSNNARPIPSVVVERAEARPFQSAWLRWLGPWRFSFGIGQMEHRRADIDSPLFMAWRVMVMPFRDIELGFSRTAQFCGKQLECDLDTFGNMLAGNDNVGIDSTAENEPGNQMAGFDIRWNSPIGDWPYAVTAQAIGEDESSYLPAKYLMQFGIETWKPLADGGLVQLFAEYADTACSATGESGPYYNCAYQQGRFNVEGYSHRGRVIGHTTDRDSRSLAVGATYTASGGELWSATVRAAELNRDGNPDPRPQLVTPPTDYAALEVGWRARLFGGELALGLGAEAIDPRGEERQVEPFGFIRWSQSFEP